jgi:uncharacterized protein
MKTIGITGGTGFVGRHLTAMLTKNGFNVVIFTRHPEKHPDEPGIDYTYWDPAKNKCDHGALNKLDAMVNLAGTAINTRWTKKNKASILDSRVHGTRFLVSQLKNDAHNCKTFISASAIGYYGPDRTGKPFEETDHAFDDFLANTCVKWETETALAQDTMRTVILRFGVAMGKDDGAFPELARPLSFGVMPIFGNGSQTMSWIHVDDLAKLLQYCIINDKMNGVYNAVTPHPASQKEIMKAIAAAKGGVSIPIPVPPLLLKTALGEMSIELLKSCTASAQKILAAGFTFRYPDIESAAKAILGK